MEAEEEGETCGICRDNLRGGLGSDKRLARIPCYKQHIFHYECIIEWTAIENSCPIDRMAYTTLQIYDGLGKLDSFVEEKVAQKRQRPVTLLADAELLDYLEECKCEQCHSGENEDALLLCDRCEAAYHTYCLIVPLSAIPEGRWYCDACREAITTEKKTKKKRTIRQKSSKSRIMNRCVDILQSQTTSRRKRARAAYFLQSRVRQGYQLATNQGYDNHVQQSYPFREKDQSKRDTTGSQELLLDDIWRQFDQLRNRRETEGKKRRDERGKKSVKAPSTSNSIYQKRKKRKECDILDWAFGKQF
jgi:hypothetical protein